MVDDWFRPDQTQRFLEALDPSASGFTFQTFGDREKLPTLARVFNGTFDEVASELVSLNKRGAGVYVTISRTDLAGRKRENVQAARAVFCDFDGVEPPPGAGALPPSMIIQSRNGKHVYWLLDLEKEADLSQWSAVQEAIAAKLGADVACKDPPRVMRLPGLRHLKGDPFDVCLLECHSERRYKLEQIVASYGLTLATKPEPRPRPSDPGSHTLADDYNERGDWSFLEHHGWHHLSDYGDEGRWSRPGKQPPGMSATTDHEGHIGILYVFSSNAAPFEANHGYSRFQAYSLLEHGGDNSAAARDLAALGFGEDPKLWGKKRAQEREDALLDQALSEGPPPDTPRPRPTLVSGPTPDDSWAPTDDDVPPEHRERTGKSKGKRRARKSKGDGADLKVYTGGGGSEDPQDGNIDFRVSKVRILDSDPPAWQFEIDGSKMLRLTTMDLDSPKRFRRRYLEVLFKRCSVPTGKGSDQIWSILVNHWMSMAEIVEQPEEASELGAIRVALRGILRDASRGETPQDLKRGRSLAHPSRPGTFIILGSALSTLLREAFGERIPPKQVGEAMHDLLCKAERTRVGSQQFRVWCFKRKLDETDWCEEGADPQAEIDLD
jgi:hypothetical protein